MKLAKKYCLFEIVFFSLLFSVEILVSAQKSRKLDSCAEVGFECVYNSDCCGVGTCVFEQCTYPTTTVVSDTISESNNNTNPNIHMRVTGSYQINNTTTTTTLVTRTNDHNSNSSTDFRNHPNFHLLPTTADCGVSTTNEYKQPTTRFRRIVGGKPAKLGQFPWMAQIVQLNISENKHRFRCGGSLINSRYVLTAAHCVSRVSAGNSLTVVNLGTYKSMAFAEELPSCFDSEEYRDRSGGCSAEIDEIITNEDYVLPTSENDVALIRLVNPVDFEDLTRIKPICLPYKKNLLAESKEPIKVAGWGRVDAYYDPQVMYSTYLNTLNLRLLPREYCDFFYSRNHETLGENRICAIGGHEKSPCNGDSGSPVSQQLDIPGVGVSGEKRTFQIGIISVGGGLSCGRYGQPFILPNVVEYMPWILDNIKP